MLAETVGAIATLGGGTLRSLPTAGVGGAVHGSTILVGIGAMFGQVRFVALSVCVVLWGRFGIGWLDRQSNKEESCS